MLGDLSGALGPTRVSSCGRVLALASSRAREERTQELAGVRGFAGRDGLGRPRDDQLAAGFAAFGANVDHPVGGLDDVEVVFDHEDRVPRLHEAIEDLEELLNVVEVEPGRGLVEDVERASCRALAQLAGELDALSLPARERRRGLPESHVAQPDVHERRQEAHDLGVVAEQLGGLGNAHVEHVRDRLALVGDPERGLVEALPEALLAGHVDVGQEVHFDLTQAGALAALAATAFDVEREAALLEPVDLRLGQSGEEVADQVEEFDVGRGVAAGGSTDRLLIDRDHLVDRARALEPIVLADGDGRLGELAAEGREEDLVDEARLARARDARHAGHEAEGELDVDSLEVVGARADHLQAALGIRRAPIAGDRDLEFARQVTPRQAVGVLG